MSSSAVQLAPGPALARKAEKGILFKRLLEAFVMSEASSIPLADGATRGFFFSKGSLYGRECFLSLSF